VQKPYICGGVMQKKLILDADLLDVTINRLCQQLIENHSEFDNSVLLGLQPRGIYLAEIIHKRLTRLTRREIPLGYLDISFFRDDFRKREINKVSELRIPFSLENKKVILIDDVLFTGRTVRAALDAMLSFGRPAKVELLVLIDRRYNRDLPIAPDYIGKVVNTIASQKVLVELQAQGHRQNKIWLINPA
jgi:pyrimidine operon attenuation protein/uracil phosphoribosyltransferase